MSINRIGIDNTINPVPFFGTLTTGLSRYDAAARLYSVSDRTTSALYSYVANSPLAGQINFAHGGANVMTSVKAYVDLNRLTLISSSGAAGFSGVVSSSGYSYNAASQRTGLTNEHGGW